MKFFKWILVWIAAWFFGLPVTLTFLYWSHRDWIVHSPHSVGSLFWIEWIAVLWIMAWGFYFRVARAQIHQYRLPRTTLIHGALVIGVLLFSLWISVSMIQTFNHFKHAQTLLSQGFDETLDSFLFAFVLVYFGTIITSWPSILVCIHSAKTQWEHPGPHAPVHATVSSRVRVRRTGIAVLCALPSLNFFAKTLVEASTLSSIANGPWQASTSIRAGAVLIFFLSYLHMCRAWIIETFVSRRKNWSAMTIQLLCLIFLYLPLSNLTSNETYIPNQTIQTVHHAASDYIFTSEMAIGFSLAVVLTLMPLQFYLCLVRKNPSPFA